jgi:uncharacterized protein (DUF2132 family)
MTARRWLGVSAGVLILAIILAAAVLGCGEGEKNNSNGEKDLSVREQTKGGERGAEEGAYGARESAVPSGNSSSSGLPQLQLKVIKTALMKMETGKGEYVKVREDAVADASSAGGYVESESSSRDDEGFTYATLTLRIPAENFDGVVSQVSSLGEVISTQISTNDVSGEYVDLESRLKHLQAEESFYLSLIGQARTIEEMISIREHLSSIQLEKEQVQGRKNFLDQQIGYSTLTLSVDEVSGEDEGGGFWHSVGEAFKSFGRGLRALAVGFFYALPYLVILVIVVGLVWLLVRRSRRGKPASPSE